MPQHFDGLPRFRVPIPAGRRSGDSAAIKKSLLRLRRFAFELSNSHRIGFREFAVTSLGLLGDRTLGRAHLFGNAALVELDIPFHIPPRLSPKE